jgi:surface carbohydrate biosynthesis protein (TIGR04326 family)
MKVLKNYCVTKKIKFTTQNRTSISKVLIFNFKNIINNTVSDSLIILLWIFKYTLNNIYFFDKNKSLWKKDNSEITFVTYMDNLINPESNSYQSLYWTSLIDKLKKDNIKTRWLHIWTKNNDIKNSRQFNSKITNWNTNSTMQVHCSLNSFLTFNVIINSLKNWRKISKTSYKIEKELMKSDDDCLNIWPLLRSDWIKSTRGTYLVSNLLMFHLFENAFKINIKQKLGIYLQENQSWEYALLYNWKTYHNTNIIGVAHSTIRFWDLRYYFDKRFFNSMNSSFLFPDFMLINNPYSKKNILESGYPPQKIKEVEALRYLYLNKIDNEKSKDSRFNLLILGDYEKSNVKLAFNILSISLKQIDINFNLFYKPHPNSKVSRNDFDDLNINITNQALDKLFNLCDVAFCCNTTSASVDAYCYGLEVIIMHDPHNLNMSPLSGLKDVNFVSESNQLVKILNDNIKNHNLNKKKNYFYLNANLPSWEKLINSYLF